MDRQTRIRWLLGRRMSQGSEDRPLRIFWWSCRQRPHGSILNSERGTYGWDTGLSVVISKEWGGAGEDAKTGRYISESFLILGTARDTS